MSITIGENFGVDGLLCLSQSSAPTAEITPPNNDRFQAVPPETDEQQKTQNVAMEELTKQPTLMSNELFLDTRTVDLTIEKDISDIINDLKKEIDSILLPNKKDSRSEALDFITSTLEQDLNKNVRAYLYQRKALILFLEAKHDEAIMAAVAGKICSPRDQDILIALNLFHAQALSFQTSNSGEDLQAKKKNILELLDNCLSSPNINSSSHLPTIINTKISLLRDKTTVKEYSNFISDCLIKYPLDQEIKYILQQLRIWTFIDFTLYGEAFLALINFEKMFEKQVPSEKNLKFIYSVQKKLIQSKIENTLKSSETSKISYWPKEIKTCLDKAQIALTGSKNGEALQYVQQGLVLHKSENDFPIQLFIQAIIALNNLGEFKPALYITESCLQTQCLIKKQSNSISEIEVELLIQKTRALVEIEKLKEPAKRDFSSILQAIEIGLKYANDVTKGKFCLLKSQVLNHTSQFLSSSIPEFKIPELPEDKRKKPDDPENSEIAKRQKQDPKKTE